MEKLSKQCYAYPDKELYPVHTKEAALKSWQEFKRDVKNYTENQLNLITNGFVKSAQARDFKYPTWQTVEATPETQTITDQGGNSATFSKIASIQDVDKAVQIIDASRDTLKGDFMRKVATELWKTADELGLQGSSMQKLARFAGVGVCDPQEVIIEFRKRGGLVNMPQSLTSKFYSTYRDLQAIKDKDSLIKVANQMCDILSEIDGIYKLASHYGAEIQAPEDVCYKIGLSDIANSLQDYLRVPSTDTILSKTALLENKQAVRSFLKEKYAEDAVSDEDILTKVASLSAAGVKALIQVLD